MHTIFFIAFSLTAAVLSSLTLDEALCRGLSYSLGLDSAALDIAIKEAETYQVSRLPNPEFSIDAGDCSMVREHTCDPCLAYGIEQYIEVVGKRRWRQSVKEAEQEIAAFSFRQKKHLLICEIEAAFYKVVRLQKEYELAKAKKALEDQVQIVLKEKLAQGKASLPEQVRQQNLIYLATLEIKKAEFALEEAKLMLAHLFGLPCPDFDEVFCHYESLQMPACIEDAALNSMLISMKEWEREAAFRMLCLEAANKIPDFKVRAGVMHENHFRKASLFVGLSVPLPIFDRNNGNYARASFAATQLEIEKQQLIRNLELEIKRRWLALEASYEEVLCYQESILKNVQTSCSHAHASFESGKIEFLESLEQKKNCLEIEGKYLEALAEFYDARIEYKKLLGPSLGGT